MEADNETPEEGITRNADGSVTVDLHFPIQHEAAPLARVTLRRLKGAQYRKVDVSMLASGDHMLRLIGQLAVLPPPSVDQLDGEDITRLSKVVMGFFGQSPATGASS